MLKLFAHLRRSPDFPLAGFAFMVSVSGLSGGALLPALNRAAEQIGARAPDAQQFFLLLTLSALTAYAQRHALLQASQAAEETALQARLRIGDKLCGAPPRFVEEADAQTLSAVLARDAGTLAQAAVSLTQAARSAIALCVCLIYLAWLTPAGLSVALGCIGLYAFYLARRGYPALVGRADRRLADERAFARGLNELLARVAAMRLDGRARDREFHRYACMAGDAEANGRSAQRATVESVGVGQIAFCLLLVAPVAILPNFGEPADLARHIFPLAVAAIFLIAELNPWLAWLPEIARAEAALQRLDALEREIDAAGGHSPAPAAPRANFGGFETLELAGVAFAYPDRGFRLGPIDLSVGRGEILFALGGNGAGKTTLLKLLAGLYLPTSGVLRADGRTVALADLPAYRELFAAVFADAPAPTRLGDLSNADVAKAQGWIERLGLQGKAVREGNAWVFAGLSPGQRRRLALIDALLADRPVLLLDEFAAGQDAELRRRVYREVLPELKAQGKTAIVAACDERDADMADRILRLADGRTL